MDAIYPLACWEYFFVQERVLVGLLFVFHLLNWAFSNDRRPPPEIMTPRFCLYSFSLLAALSCGISDLHAASSSIADNTSGSLSPVIVEGRAGWLDEESYIGETKRPEWTSRCRFGTTRVYIQYEPWKWRWSSGGV